MIGVLSNDLAIKFGLEIFESKTRSISKGIPLWKRVTFTSSN